VVVAIKLDIIEGCRDSIPAGHGGGLCAADVSHGGHDDVAEAQRFADQHDFKFDGGANWQLPGAEKINAGGTDVAGNEGYRRLLRDSAGAAKAQGEVQSRTGVFSMFRMHAYSVRRYPDETPRMVRTK
jgi:hypothetical protein